MPAQGDLLGAIDRLRAGQKLTRTGPLDFVEASIIDSRLRELEAERARSRSRPARRRPSLSSAAAGRPAARAHSSNRCSIATSMMVEAML